MIQFNLLPDVKLEYVKAERTKHAVVSGAVIATGVAFGIFLLLFVAVHVVQNKIMSDQKKSIAAYSSELKKTPDLDKILTIQNQLQELPALHAGKPAASRTFNLIQQITPMTVSLTDVLIDYTEHTVTISGVGPTLGAVNTMVDTVKFAQYKADKDPEKRTFSKVVLSEFSRTATESTFTISASFDQAIFDNAKNVTFSVPPGTSTRSVLDQPTLFTKPKTDTGN